MKCARLAGKPSDYTTARGGGVAGMARRARHPGRRSFRGTMHWPPAPAPAMRRRASTLAWRAAGKARRARLGAVAVTGGAAKECVFCRLKLRRVPVGRLSAAGEAKPSRGPEGAAPRDRRKADALRIACRACSMRLRPFADAERTTRLARCLLIPTQIGEEPKKRATRRRPRSCFGNSTATNNPRARPPIAAGPRPAADPCHRRAACRE